MAPTSRLILTRHAQAQHNVDLDFSIPDAPLTALGKKQAMSLAPQITDLQQEVNLIITSPLRRTMQTTQLGWGPAVKRLGIANVICLPQAQECAALPCDSGSSREELEGDSEFTGFDFRMLTPDWTSKQGVWAPDAQSIAKRARYVRQFLRDRPEKNIVLVGHGDILRAITSSEHGFSTYDWRNAECRIFTFDEKYVDREECYLQEEKAILAFHGYDRTDTEADLVYHSADKMA